MICHYSLKVVSKWCQKNVISTYRGSVVECSLIADGEKKTSKDFEIKEFRCKDGFDMILIGVDFVKNSL